MIKAYHIESGKWLCTYLKRHLTSKEDDASIFLNKDFILSYIKKINMSPVQFKLIKCNYKGESI